jgi:hypothetical protein
VLPKLRVLSGIFFVPLAGQIGTIEIARIHRSATGLIIHVFAQKPNSIVIVFCSDKGSGVEHSIVLNGDWFDSFVNTKSIIEGTTYIMALPSLSGREHS